MRSAPVRTAIRPTSSFGIGAQIPADLGIHDMILLRTSNRHVITGVGGYGLEIVGEVLGAGRRMSGFYDAAPGNSV